MSILDLRDRQAPAGPPSQIVNGIARSPGRILQGKLVLRDLAKIVGVTLHQTATRLPPGMADLAAAKGDPILAKHLRALRVHAHVTAFDTGTACIAYPLRAYVYHANNLNAEDIGLEGEASVDGLASSDVPEGTIEAMRDALTWLCENGPAEGIHLRFIDAHRQSSATRRGDPGLQIWRAVALDHAVAKLGLKTRPGYVLGNGRPIPRDWQPDGGVGEY